MRAENQGDLNCWPISPASADWFLVRGRSLPLNIKTLLEAIVRSYFLVYSPRYPEVKYEFCFPRTDYLGHHYKLVFVLCFTQCHISAVQVLYLRGNGSSLERLPVFLFSPSLGRCLLLSLSLGPSLVLLCWLWRESYTAQLSSTLSK